MNIRAPRSGNIEAIRAAIGMPTRLVPVGETISSVGFV